MKYVVYEVTCTINGKTYVGKHQTTDVDDGYLGSGKLLTRAIKKYGRDKFSKRVLFIFDNEAEMNAKEAEIVTEEFCASDDNYNLCPGGQGGWGYVNTSGIYTSEQRSLNARKRRDMSGTRLGGMATAEKLKDPLFRSEFSRKIRESGRTDYRTRLGKKNSPEQNEKIRKAAIEREARKRKT